MKTKRYIHNGLNCEYLISGNGSRVLYCFHGFGGSLYDWEVFVPELSEVFTLYSFSDFFHGSSTDPSDRYYKEPLSKGELTEFYQEFARQNEHTEINLMAFSSGGRIALTLIENKAFKINEVWLFAPDGLSLSFWNKAFCNYSIIQKAYNRLVKKPEVFFKTVHFLVKTRILNRDLAKFVLYSMRTEEKRERIYHYWMLYRKVIPMRKKLNRAIESGVRKMHIIVGSDDKVIPTKSAYDFKKGIDSEVNVIELKTGHLLISEAHLKEIIKVFRQTKKPF